MSNALPSDAAPSTLLSPPAGPVGDLLVAEPASLTGTLIGYARVSTREQLLDRQLRALEGAGCARVFTDKLSGRTADRPELERCLDYLRPGDTLVVPSLDRLSRSLQDLIGMIGELRRHGVGFRSLHEALDTTTPGGRLVFHVFAALAEFIRELIVEGTKEGLDAARARGTRLGRPPALTGEQVAHARQLLTNPDNSVASIARLLGVSRSTLYTHVPKLTGGRTRSDPTITALDTTTTSTAVTARPEPAATAAPAPPEGTGRVVDLSSELGDGWRLVEVEDGTWQVRHHGVRVGSVSRDATSRGRRGWRARLADGLDVPATGSLAVAGGSTLWRTRDLAAAAIAHHHSRADRCCLCELSP